MHLSFSPAADADLTDIASFIARDNVARALTFIDELQAACTKLLDFPGSGTVRSELRPDLRSRVYGSYVIFYTLVPGSVRIERILHGARDVSTILS